MSRKLMFAVVPFFRLRRDVKSVVIACLLIITSPLYADDACTSATFMELDSSLRSHVGRGGPFLVELEAPAAGILSVDASAPLAPAAEPGIVVTLVCLPESASEPIAIERSASHLILAVDAAGPYVFRVASQDPRRLPGELKLRSAFVADDAAGGFVPCFGKDGEDEEVIEIDGFASPSGPFLAKDGEDEEVIEIDGSPFAGGSPCFGKDGEDEEVIEIDGFAAPDPSRSLLSKLDQLCRQGEVDDHGDSFTCATFLRPGRAVTGEIGNGWGDDVDTFHFILGALPEADLWTVTIETFGDVDTVGGLYDRSSQRLDAADHSGRGDNFRIVRSLSPGAYYVRVEGREGAEGPYALSVATSR